MPTLANPLACNPTLRLAVLDATGAASTQVSPDSAATLRVTLTQADGRAVPGVVLTSSPG
jgi:hypothetical protein